ncbi:hypothetical protein CAEBREN_00147 [Caenorhabditis brenneri]|uniref:Uncharacterized protein n=1 Tax=Caenorhabditis brenneri TaxID=135651 RepID=G0N7X0_CAEBE|nr:hypothetical protein CAEBREN_00147 [Caenorhabditis brenneri]
MATNPIAEALLSGNTVMETGFPYAMQLTNDRCEEIEELEQKVKDAETANTHLKYSLALQIFQTKNVKEFFTGKIQQLQTNLTEATARLDTKTEDVQKVVEENDKLGKKIAEQAGIIFQSNAQRRMVNLDAARSQQAHYTKKANSQPKMAHQLTSTPPTQVAAQSQQADYSTKSILPPLLAQQHTPPPPTQVATRKRGRPKMNPGPLHDELPPNAYKNSKYLSAVAKKHMIPNFPMGQNEGITAHQLAVAEQNKHPNFAMWQNQNISAHLSAVIAQHGDSNAPMCKNQETETSGSDSSGRHDSADIK